MRGLDMLRRHGDWTVLTTGNAANGDHGRVVYSFLRDEDGRRLAPAAEPGQVRARTKRPLHSGTKGDQLDEKDGYSTESAQVDEIPPAVSGCRT